MKLAAILRASESLYAEFIDLMLILSMLLLAGYFLYVVFIRPIIKSKKIKSDIVDMGDSLEKIEEHGESMSLKNESRVYGDLVFAWIKNNLKKGDSAEKLNDPDLMSLISRHQEVYLKIIKIDPMWADKTDEPIKLYANVLEVLSRGLKKQAH